jgi:hypothetical protein
VTAERRVEAEVHGGLAQGGLEEAWNRGQARTARVRLCIARMGASKRNSPSLWGETDFLLVGGVTWHCTRCRVLVCESSARRVAFLKFLLPCGAVRSGGGPLCIRFFAQK